MASIKGILIKLGENSRSARVIKFNSIDQVLALETTLKTYLCKAIAAEKAGLTVALKNDIELVFPDELQVIFAAEPAFKDAFHSLTPGRQRGYNLHFAQAKQSITRTTRIEKCMNDIFAGKGLHDR